MEHNLTALEYISIGVMFGGLALIAHRLERLTKAIYQLYEKMDGDE